MTNETPIWSRFKTLLGKARRSSIAAAIVSVLAMGNLVAISTPASALSVDASAAAFNFDAQSGGNSTLISGASTADSGAVIKFSNVTGTTIPGVSIDAVVTTTLSGSTIANYDNKGSASSNADYFQVNTAVTSAKGFASFKFDFYEGGTYSGPNTGIPIVLRNVSVTSIDLDGNGYCQFTDFTGFQSYVLGSPSNLVIKKNADDSSIPLGTTRFFATSCQANSNILPDAVQVQFDSVTSFTAKFGTDITSSPNYFGIAFKPLSVLYPGGSLAGGVSNPTNQAPTSNNTTVYATSGQAQILQLADFGTYADADNNPFTSVKITTLPTAGTLEKFVNGSWVAVALNDVISVADITNGNLRYTGAADNSLQFKVYDGGLYSTAAYTMSLLMASQPQTIAFNNPGSKTPTSPSFASGATADSGLTVTLTSLTPGVCTVSALNIVPVASGQCTIVATQTGNRSYSEATPVSQTFPITTLTAQTITAPNPGNQTFNGSSFTITRAPTASSGLTVTMISTTPSVCTVSGFVITILGPGNCTIRNSQAGNGTYGPAPLVEYTFNVAPASVNYTLTYNGNSSDGGTVPTAQTGSGNVTVAANLGLLTRSGYSFTGWNTLANGSGTHYNIGSTYNLTADVTLYAEWATSTYTLFYDGNGNTGGSAPSAQTGNGNVTVATNSGTLTNSGYTFTGWNTLANGSGTHYATGSTYNLNADVTLYAEWTAAVTNYTITYRGNGNTGGAVGPDTVGADGSTVIIDNNTGSLVKTGFRFNGWNTAANGTGTAYEEGTSIQITGNLTLYAVWVPLSFTITFDGNTATSGSAPTTVTGYGSKTITSAAGTLVKTGYIFKGWNTQADGLGTRLGTSYNLVADVTFYAEWQLTPAIIYSPNGATGGTTPNDIPNGAPITIDPNTGNLIRAGYRFLGWNTQPNGGGTHYGAGMTPILPEGTVLYAEWAKLPSLASTGSNYGEEIAGASALIGLGLFFNAIAVIRRRKIRKH